MNLDYLINIAFEEARQALKEDEVPVGAVIVYGGRILGRGHNRTRALKDPTAHAELIAITAACETLGEGRLDGCDIITTLEPCPMCAGAMVLARLGKLFYAAPDYRMGACGSILDLVRDVRLNHRLEVYPLPQYEPLAKDLLTEFFRAKRTDD